MTSGQLLLVSRRTGLVIHVFSGDGDATFDPSGGTSSGSSVGPFLDGSMSPAEPPDTETVVAGADRVVLTGSSGRWEISADCFRDALSLLIPATEHARRMLKSPSVQPLPLPRGELREKKLWLHHRLGEEDTAARQHGGGPAERVVDFECGEDGRRAALMLRCQNCGLVVFCPEDNQEKASGG